MKVFSSNRIAYLEELDSDPEVQKAIKSHSAGRLRFNTESARQGSKYPNQWNPEAFRECMADNTITFDHNYGIMYSEESANVGVGDIELDKDKGYVVAKKSRYLYGINPTDDPTVWDPKTKTLIYINKNIYDDFKNSLDFQDALVAALDSNLFQRSVNSYQKLNWDK